MTVLKWARRIIGAGLLVLAAAVIYGFLAPLKVHGIWSPATAPSAVNRPETAPFVGLALSGGGSRAAIFGAAGMQALAERGLMDAVTHVSSVSGGGFPASYLAVNPMPDCSDIAAAPTCLEDYFAGMKAMAVHGFLWDIEIAQVISPLRAFSPSRRLVSLQEALDASEFLGGTDFASIGAERTFYFNAVSYDQGKRFVFSTAPLPHPDEAQHTALPASVLALSFSEPGALRTTPADFPVSLAVATSAAFPPYLGPTTIQRVGPVGQADQFWHLGDGGVFENTGIETLREVIAERPVQTPAIIYSFNAGRRLDSELSQSTSDISIWSRDISRLVDVVVFYAGLQREALFDEIKAEAGLEITEISFNYLDVEEIVESDPEGYPQWLDWSAWPDCGRGDHERDDTPASHLASVPTSLKITGCNATLLAAAAEMLVERAYPRGTDQEFDHLR